MRTRISLETTSDVKNFVTLCNKIPKNRQVSLVDNTGNRVDARSFLGCLYSMSEWNEIYCESEEDIGPDMYPFVYTK